MTTRGPGRAAPLPPAERRAAIIDAVLPLIRTHGRALSTKQIADAAGIAEGTIFRVFPDKDAVVDAALDRAMDQAPALAALRAIGPQLPLEERIRLAVAIVAERIQGMWQLLSALSITQRPPSGPESLRRRAPFSPGAGGLTDGLTELLVPDADRLAVSPDRAAHLLRALIFAGTHPIISGSSPLTQDEIVNLLLNGVLIKESPC